MIDSQMQCHSFLRVLDGKVTLILFCCCCFQLLQFQKEKSSCLSNNL